MSIRKQHTVTITNGDVTDKYGVAQRSVYRFSSLEAAQEKFISLEASGHDVQYTPPSRLVAPLDLETADVFYAEDGQKWTVVEVLPVVNKGHVGATNVTATSNELGHNQRGSFSFGNTRVKVVSK